MIFEKHSELEGLHAFLSPSNYHWVNYSPDKLADRYLKKLAVERGTELHEFACTAIRLGRMQPRNKDTVNLYINDAIGFRMTPEQPLFYSYNCFGTADAISYSRNTLRIHDLKTGEIEANMLQLKIYAALFCLNYQAVVRDLRKKGAGDIDIAARLGVAPKELHFEPEKMNNIELRIYQLGDIRVDNPDPAEIRNLMNTIVESDQVIKSVKAEGFGDEG